MLEYVEDSLELLVLVDFDLFLEVIVLISIYIVVEIIEEIFWRFMLRGYTIFANSLLDATIWDSNEL